MGGLIFVADALDDVVALRLQGQLQASNLGLHLLHGRMGRGQGSGKLGKLAAKVGELDLVVFQRFIVEHLGQGLGRSAGNQLVHRLLGDTVALRLGELLLKLPQLFFGHIALDELRHLFRSEQQAGSVSIGL